MLLICKLIPVKLLSLSPQRLAHLPYRLVEVGSEVTDLHLAFIVFLVVLFINLQAVHVLAVLE